MNAQSARRYCPEDNRYVLAVRNKPSHVLHLLLSIITVGFWIPVWVVIAMFSDAGYRCPICGGKTVARKPMRTVFQMLTGRSASE